MTIYYLYKKTHNKTGLQYLGYTTRDPYIYKGSGIKWGEHLSIHGDDISTEILLESTNKEDIQKLGRHFSELWDIVRSGKWANSMKETCGGPGGKKGIARLESTKQKLSEKLSGKTHTPEQKLAKSQRQKGKPKSPQWVEKMTGRKNPLISLALSGKAKPIIQCPNCGKEGGSSAMHRWHFSNCKSLLDKS
jgi:hypothetical protein